jgi:arsenate reductase
MNKIYYIASCDTCRKIIKSLPKGNDLVFRDIKQDPLTAEELEEMYQLRKLWSLVQQKSPVV